MDKEDNRLIIIPDVHGRSFWREAVKSNPDGKFIFLGDYLDPYTVEEIIDSEAFQGLEDIIRLKKDRPDDVILLWGNHDLHYLYPELLGSRYDFEHAERNAHMFWDNQTLFQMDYETVAGGRRFLFSHAGIGKCWLSHYFPTLSFDGPVAELMNDLVGYPDFMSALGDVSINRGGDKRYGSMIWADLGEQFYEENQLPGIVQVFGHTQLQLAPFNLEDKAFCLDFRQAFYLDLNDGCIYGLSDNKKPIRSEIIR